jgi:ABC-2 type transport system ATP-binding protein
VLEVGNLTKRFAGVHVLRGVSFSVARGEILGYLGPNGSGKSTTFKIIAGLLEPTLGTIRFDGANVADDAVAFRRRFGYVPDEPYLYTHLTAAEYLMLVGRLRNIPEPRLRLQVSSALDLLDLSASEGNLLSAFSKGMRQRVLLGAALLHDPALLVLDEPFSGLDVNASLLLVAVLRALAARGRMILLSSHRMDLVESLCGRVIILHRGQIVAEGTPRELQTRRDSETLDEVFALVTEQQDYSARANQLLDLVQRQ